MVSFLRPFALLSLLSACGGGASVLHGRVLSEDGAPLAGAQIETEPETDLAVSNKSGHFTIRHVAAADGSSKPIPAGTYKIKVKLFGYADASIDATVGEEAPKAEVILSKRRPDTEVDAPTTTAESFKDPGQVSTPVGGNP